MTQYCFNIDNPTNEEIDENLLRSFVQNLYKNTKDFENVSPNSLPFITIYVKEDKSICIVLTSKSKKTLEKIESINNTLKGSKLRFGNITLSEPYLFDTKAQEWWVSNMNKKTGNRWNSIIQSGPYFAHIDEPYKYLEASLEYEGRKYKLNSEEEKYASFYAKRIIAEEGGGVTELWTQDDVFNENYWKDFKNYLTSDHKRIFKDFKKIGWRDIIKKIKDKSEYALTKAEKRAKKIKAEEKKKKYGYAILDGNKEKVGNYNIEPAAIFYGRGDNPKRGKIKTDIQPEDVTINIGENDPVPEPPKGHQWRRIVHDHNSVWLASWEDSITRSIKYVMFSAEGRFKGEGDFVKYEKARKLQKHIETVREKYMIDASSNNIVKKQLGTVLYLIDHFGIRVGNEKSEEETDTVGASTLRVGHVKLESPNVIFDFLGKDSIRFYKKVEVTPLIYNNFELFIQNKKKDDDLFDEISSKNINIYLKEFDHSFSAKVFRTRLASIIMFNALEKVNVPKDSTKIKIKSLFNKANAKVADVLNHTRNISKKAQEAVKTLEENLKNLKKEKVEKKKEGKNIDAIDKRINNIKVKIDSKNDTMNVAITTSLNNYIDPRLVVAWTKKQKIDTDSIYSSTLMKKFKWAISTTDKNWNYISTPLIGNPELEPIEEEEENKSPIKKQKSPKRKSLAKLSSKKKININKKVPNVKKVFSPHNKPLNLKLSKEKQYKIILDFCNFPSQNINNLSKVSKEVFDWLYPFCKYALSLNLNKKINNMLVKYYIKRFKL